MANTKKPRKPQRKKKVPLGHDAFGMISNGQSAKAVFMDSVRYVYQGLPTRPARYLLQACRRPVVPELMRGMRGIRQSDPLPYHMSQWGFMQVIPMKEGRRSQSYFITEDGLEILRHWARNNRDFHAYANAYIPFDIEDRIKIMRVDISMGIVR